MVHVECKPDEILVSKLGFPKKQITHHQGKPRIFYALSKTQNQFAMIDEDPGCAKTNDEKALLFIEESEGIKYYTDKSNNKICILKVEFEDWIINACKKSKIKLSFFGLPGNSDDLHDVINHKLPNFEKLIDELITKKNPAISKLKDLLK